MPAPTLPDGLTVLAELDEGKGVSLTRIAKRLGLTVSVLMREYTALSEAKLGGVAGPGFVRLECDAGGRWLAHLTELGRTQCQQR